MQKPPVDVRPAVDADRGAVAGVLARAFIDDPAMAYLFRDANDRPRRLARFFGLIASIDQSPGHWALAQDSAGALAAAALWRPTGEWRTPVSVMAANILPLVQVFGLGLVRALSMQGVIEKHHPVQPHWYLQFVGAVPQVRGQGLGGAVIRKRLAMCDADGMPAALETATPGNLGIYEAMGFRVSGTYQISDGPQFWSMWREPGGLGT